MIGLRLDDFAAMTPEEFEGVWSAWHAREENAERGRWERTRMMCTCMLQPYSNERLRPTDVMRFAWDAAEGGGEAAPAAAMTHEEELAAYRAAKRAAGLI